jgi:pheromone shutdown protein TraB
MTSVNPLLAPGWFTGYLELRHTPVNIADIGEMNELLGDTERSLWAILADLREIPLFRLVVIIAMTNVGSIVASGLFVVFVLPLFSREVGGVDGVSRLMVEGAQNSADIVWQTLTNVL